MRSVELLLITILTADFDGQGGKSDSNSTTDFIRSVRAIVAELAEASLVKGAYARHGKVHLCRMAINEHEDFGPLSF